MQEELKNDTKRTTTRKNKSVPPVVKTSFAEDLTEVCSKASQDARIKNKSSRQQPHTSNSRSVAVSDGVVIDALEDVLNDLKSDNFNEADCCLGMRDSETFVDVRDVFDINE